MTIDFLDSNCEANIAENFRRTEAAIDEGGGGGGWLKVTMTEDSESGVTTLDKTAGEIYAAFPFVIAVKDDEGELTAYRLDSQFSDVDGYEFSFHRGNNSPWVFYSSAADDYPTDEKPGGGGD